MLSNPQHKWMARKYKNIKGYNMQARRTMPSNPQHKWIARKYKNIKGYNMRARRTMPSNPQHKGMARKYKNIKGLQSDQLGLWPPWFASHYKLVKSERNYTLYIITLDTGLYLLMLIKVQMNLGLIQRLQIVNIYLQVELDPVQIVSPSAPHSLPVNQMNPEPPFP